jgi:pimeloyl-ACP methyl ester carboxylesterase
MSAGKAGVDTIQGSEGGQSTTRILAGLAADDYGESDLRPPVVLIHGLTFDRRLWRPALAELCRIDPGRRVLSFDLPGHGESPAWPSYDVETLADGVHRALEEAQVRSPVVVGHSLGAIIATVFAGRHPTCGVVNVDQSLRAAPFAGLLRSMADKLRGPAFPAIWEMFTASMHIELLSEDAQNLVRSASRPSQDLVLGYWREVLELPIDELAERTSAGIGMVRAALVPYLVVAGADLEPDDQRWLREMLPDATLTVWEGSGHFPHLAYPDRFATCLAATAQWPEGTSSELAP